MPGTELIPGSSLNAPITRSTKDVEDKCTAHSSIVPPGPRCGRVEAALYGQSAPLSIPSAPACERATALARRRRTAQPPSDVALLYRRISGVTETPWTSTEVATTASVSPVSSLAISSETPWTIAYIR
jgi:hypothetical protein